MTCCGVATAMSQGSSRVPPSPSDQQVNTGTVPGLPLARVSSVVVGLGPPSADRLGMGRSRRSSPRPGEPVTWRRAAVVPRSPRPTGRGSWMLSCRKDAPPNGGAPVTGVSERQATLHRWALFNRPRQEPWRARCGESRTPGSGERPGETDREQSRHRAPGRLHRNRPFLTAAMQGLRVGPRRSGAVRGVSVQRQLDRPMPR